ncbi:ras-related protein Rab-24-like isoform X3 [Macrosteles quadrilineatus]|uniref:ras-related protein Rab-24-like isoform X3 n=1 Tax=Macrosteles quadrilineatus TaxID=74068 RepID=UPI0023E18A17|nr:ras-related protein Rab-24-like isoform X3 [Macrosteles quadrilineatus]
MASAMNSKVQFKVVILGTEGVGKTCLLNRIVYDKFTDKYQMTVTGVYRAKFCSYNGETVQVGIWDTVGTERYRSMNQLFYRGAKAAIVCYDICDSRTWQDSKYWLSQLRLHEEDCKIYLCGTKKDLVKDGNRPRDIDFEVTTKHAAGIQAKIIEVSSKTGENVNVLFKMIVDDYMDSHNSREEMSVEENIRLSPKPLHRRLFCCS